jgi:hypothetical protein
MAYEICEAVFKRGWLTRKAVFKAQSVALDTESKKCGRDPFVYCREKVREYATARRNADRGVVLATLETLHFDKFPIADLARILYQSEAGAVAGARGLAWVDKQEQAYNENRDKAALIRNGMTLAFPKAWSVDIAVSSLTVGARFYPPCRKGVRGVYLSDAENILAFMQMLIQVSEMLKTAKIGFVYETLEKIHDVWSMGESTYCYSATPDTSGWDVLKDEHEKPNRGMTDYYSDPSLPDWIKAVILDYVRKSIVQVQWGVYTDGEGCSYNSLTRKRLTAEDLATIPPPKVNAA